MINENCTFNPLYDKREVESLPLEDYSISHMLTSGVVSGKSLSEFTPEYNDLSPNKIAGRVNDNFAAIEMNKAYRKFGKVSSESGVESKSE